MRAATNFKAEWFFSAIGDHFIDFNRITITVAKLAKRTHFFPGNFGWVFSKADFKILTNLFVNNFFYFIKLFAGNFFWMAKVKTQTLFRNIAAVLNNMVAQNLAQSLVH